MLMRFDPFREVDRLMNQATRSMPIGFPMDAVRRGEEVVVRMDLPGVDPDAIEVTAERGTLTVSAERGPWHREGDQVLAGERPQGRFTRQLLLSDTLDTEHLDASYDSGVLTVVIPVAEQAKPRRFSVSTSGRPETIEAQSTTIEGTEAPASTQHDATPEHATA